MGPGQGGLCGWGRPWPAAGGHRRLCRRESLWPGAGLAVAWDGPPESVLGAAHSRCCPLPHRPWPRNGLVPSARPDAALSPSSHTGPCCRDLCDAVSVSLSAAPRQHTLSPLSHTEAAADSHVANPAGPSHLRGSGHHRCTALRAPRPAGNILLLLTPRHPSLLPGPSLPSAGGRSHRCIALDPPPGRAHRSRRRTSPHGPAGLQPPPPAPPAAGLSTRPAPHTSPSSRTITPSTAFCALVEVGAGSAG